MVNGNNFLELPGCPGVLLTANKLPPDSENSYSKLEPGKKENIFYN